MNSSWSMIEQNDNQIHEGGGDTGATGTKKERPGNSS